MQFAPRSAIGNSHSGIGTGTGMRTGTGRVFTTDGGVVESHLDFAVSPSFDEKDLRVPPAPSSSEALAV